MMNNIRKLKSRPAKVKLLGSVEEITGVLFFCDSCDDIKRYVCGSENFHIVPTGEDNQGVSFSSWNIDMITFL